MKKSIHINWTNTLFLTLAPIIGVVGTVILAMHHAIPYQTVLLTLFLVVMGGFSITAGYHRLFSHQTYKASWIVRLILVIFGSATFEGSVLEWCTDHRNHHRYTDHLEKDPYSIKRGFWYAHIGWLFTLNYDKRDFSNVEDLAKDPIVRFQHKYYVYIAVFTGLILPAIIAGVFWGNFWGGLFLAGFLRATITQQFTFCINSICHMFGKQTYSDRITARDHWWTALLTFGEGYHNFHHQFPLDYRNAIRYYQFDPTKWLIYGLSKLGLTSGLKRVSDKKIIEYKLRMDEERLLAEAKNQSSVSNRDTLLTQVNNIIAPVKESIQTTLAKVEELEKAYKEFRLAEQRQKLREARRELKYSLLIWSQMITNTPSRLVANTD